MASFLQRGGKIFLHSIKDSTFFYFNIFILTFSFGLFNFSLILVEKLTKAYCLVLLYKKVVTSLKKVNTYKILTIGHL